MWGEVLTEPHIPPGSQESRNESFIQRKFLGGWPKAFTASTRENISAPITTEEAGEVLRRMRVAAAPGPDGLTVNVYQHQWDLLGPLWLAMIEEAEEKGALPEGVTVGRVPLLPKSDSKIRKAEENRPISTLNSDYKLLTTLMASRLNGGMGEVVGELQTGFIAGRFIGDNVIFNRDMLAQMRIDENQQAVIFLDFQKAYDRVKWEWLWKVLEHVGLEGRFLNLTKACYASPSITLMLEGVSMGQLSPTRGVRQGCPLSPLLFALSIEPLHYRLRTHRQLVGLRLPRTTDNKRLPNVRASLFADDVTLFPADEVDARRMLGIVKEFGYASGSALNMKKSLVVFALPSQQKSFAGLTVVQPGDTVKSLGILYGPAV